MKGFSLKRAVGITDLKRTIATTTGIPTTKQGRVNKVRRMFGINIIVNNQPAQITPLVEEPSTLVPIKNKNTKKTWSIIGIVFGALGILGSFSYPIYVFLISLAILGFSIYGLITSKKS